MRLVVDTNILISALLTSASLLALRRFEGAKIVTVRDFLTLHRRMP